MTHELLPCPQWKIDLIKDFPWETDDPDGDLERSWTAYEAKLLSYEKTEPGSSAEYEYGENVFRLTALGKQAYEAAHSAALSSPADDVAGWQDISTAPRDGMKIISSNKDGEICIVKWVTSVLSDTHDHWKAIKDYDGKLYKPTHWMALPAPPEIKE